MLFRSGDAGAVKRLATTECPEGLEYLRDWTYALFGRSGVGMDGVAPLSWRELEAWERGTRYEPSLMDKVMLMRLDAILRHPDANGD